MSMMYIHVYLCFAQNWWRMLLLMNSWLIVVVMRCCCWWFILWGVIIMDLWCELNCCWGFLWKWLNWWILLKWYLISSLMCFWKPFSVHKPIKKLWGRIRVLGESKLGFLGEKWWKTRKNMMKFAWISLMASSVWKQLAYG